MNGTRKLTRHDASARCRYHMVDDAETDEIVSWTGDGKQFTIHQLNEFSSKLLPTNFKHSNFRSFVRQLNSYVRVQNSPADPGA